jgi:hypothetical protein
MCQSKVFILGRNFRVDLKVEIDKNWLGFSPIPLDVKHEAFKAEIVHLSNFLCVQSLSQLGRKKSCVLFYELSKVVETTVNHCLDYLVKVGFTQGDR